MATAIVARSVLRSGSASVRASASRISGSSKSTSASARRSPFCIRTQKPLSHRIFSRSPVEMSCVAGFSFHTTTTTASASLTSTVSYICGWPIDDS